MPTSTNRTAPRVIPAARPTPRSAEPTLAELQESLRIDPDDLGLSSAMQPELFYRVAEQYALAVSIRDAASQRVKDIDAELDGQLRRSAVDEGQKFTEKQIEMEKRLLPKFKEANTALEHATREVGRWSALKEAYVQRSYALKDLTSIFVTRHYDNGGDAEYARRRMNDHRSAARMPGHTPDRNGR